MREQRLGWVDTARGIAILLVVLWHTLGILSTLGVPTADPWRRMLDATGPMRIPGFFVVAGLFVHRFVGRPREVFLRRRVWHFLHIFAVWAAITIVVESVLVATSSRIAEAGVSRGTATHILRLESPLWYLVALAAFHLVWLATRSLPAWLVVGVACLPWLAFELGWRLPESLSSTGTDGMVRFLVFFLVGARLGPGISAAVTRMRAGVAVGVLGAWLLVEVLLPGAPFRSLLAVPALFAIARLARGRTSQLLRLAGRNSLPLYLTNWTLLCAIGAVLAHLQLPEVTAVRLLTPLLAEAAVVAVAATLWRLTRDVPGLYGPPARRRAAASDPLMAKNAAWHSSIEATSPTPTCP